MIFDLEFRIQSKRAEFRRILIKKENVDGCGGHGLGVLGSGRSGGLEWIDSGGVPKQVYQRPSDPNRIFEIEVAVANTIEAMSWHPIYIKDYATTAVIVNWSRARKPIAYCIPFIQFSPLDPIAIRLPFF